MDRGWSLAGARGAALLRTLAGCAGLAALGGLGLAGCAELPGPDDLHPEGPPMIVQVRLDESYQLDGERMTRTVFGFGSHPEALAGDVHPVTSAARQTALRVVLDELVRGDALEELACRHAVDDDSFARVPPGATPDDVLRCAARDAELAARCPGSSPRSLCICRLDAGCPAGGRVVPRGESVGVLDLDQDGAADLARFIAGAVGLACGGSAIAIDLGRSFWTPSGNQRRPTPGGFDALGPAIVLTPAEPLPAGATCGLTVSPDVVDRDGNRVCAPPGGDRRRGCTPGDVSAFQFGVEP